MSYYNQAVKDLAPCGLDCSRCVSYKNGDVVRLSSELKQALIHFDKMAEVTKKFNPVLNHYADFLAILEYFSNGQCEGCRSTLKPSPGCSIRTCHKQHNVNFCSECSSFPCTPNTYNPNLAQTWLENNQSILKDGVDAFYLQQKSKPRY